MKHSENTPMMESCRSKIYKILTITGAFLLLLPIGIPWYWGNLSIYVLSFYYMERASVSLIDSSWVVSLFLIFRGIFCLLCGLFIPTIGRRMTILIGIAAFNLGMLGSYFALQYSIIVFYLMLGLLCGIGAGILYGTAILCVAQWSDHCDVGITTSITQSAYPFGSMIINELVTMYINTNNMKPDCPYKDTRLFSQTSILKYVPNVFLIFATSFSLIQLIGLSIIREKKDNLEETVQSNSAADESLTITDSAGDHECAPKELIRTPTFYSLAMTYMLDNYIFLIIVNYYKAFGQLWVRDDHFLTYIGMSMAICNALTRILYGVLIDKIGPNNTLITAFSFITIACSFEFVMPMISRWLYLITSTSLACMSGAMVSVYTATTILVFGRKNAVTNFGLLNIPSMILIFLAPSIMEAIVSKEGWHALFLSGTFVSLTDLLITIKCLRKM